MPVDARSTVGSKLAAVHFWQLIGRRLRHVTIPQTARGHECACAVCSHTLESRGQYNYYLQSKYSCLQYNLTEVHFVI